MKHYYIIEVENGHHEIKDLKYIVESRKGVKMLGEVQGSYLKVTNPETEIPTHLLFKN